MPRRTFRSPFCPQPDLEIHVHAVSNEFGIGKLPGSHVEARAVHFGIAAHAEFSAGEQVVAIRRQSEIYRLTRLDALEIECAVGNVSLAFSRNRSADPDRFRVLLDREERFALERVVALAVFGVGRRELDPNVDPAICRTAFGHAIFHRELAEATGEAGPFHSAGECQLTGLVTSIEAFLFRRDVKRRRQYEYPDCREDIHHPKPHFHTVISIWEAFF